MATVTRGYCWIYLIQFAIYQVSAHQQPIAQYLISNYGSIPNGIQNLPRATASVPIQKPLPQNPHYINPNPPLVQKPKPELNSGPLDTNVLNNLAIALQLLIVSNLMNKPMDPDLSIPKYAEAKVEPVYEIPSYTVPKSSYNQYKVYETQMPNANFLGSAGFSDPVLSSIGVAKANSRSSMTLMSPYDALGTSLEPTPSFSYSKKDFQNPYSMLADSGNDFFNMADLF